MLKRTICWGSVLLLAMGCAAGAQDQKSFEQRITTKVLPNGLTILI